MPQYSIMQDKPWMEQPARAAHPPSASIYGDDDYQAAWKPSDMPDAPPLQVEEQCHQQLQHPQHHQHHQHHPHHPQRAPSPQPTGHGPPLRHSRLPIFRQVRSMLHKPSKLDMSRIGRPREGSRGTTSATPEVKHASAKSTQEAHDLRPQCPGRERSSSSGVSPISLLQDNGWERSTAPGSDWEFHSGRTPVSDIADFAYRGPAGPNPVSAHAHGNAMPETSRPVPRLVDIKRKHVPRSISCSDTLPLSQRSPSPPPSRDIDCASVSEMTRAERDPQSRFSWTTYGGSGTPVRPSFDLASRPSMDRPSTGRSMESEAAPYSRQLSRLGEEAAVSHFSWGSVNTGMPNTQNCPDSPPPSPPALAPTKYKAPPVQSILSRHRPIQRQQEQEEWNPPPHTALSATSRASDTLTSVNSKLNLVINHQRSATEEAPGSAQKSPPPPPDVASLMSPRSHLEMLLVKERDMTVQRKSIERAIVENAKIENASPMEVAFSEVRVAKKELEMLRARLEEIRLEERDIGISIARARRKECYGEGEGLWVRRVTG